MTSKTTSKFSPEIHARAVRMLLEHESEHPSRLSTRARRDLALKEEVGLVFGENFAVYGACNMWRQLRREDQPVARCTVERLMRSMGLQGVIRGKVVRTTVSDKAASRPLGKVNRQFRAERPNQLWGGDFTYISTWSWFVYVAFIIDVFASYIVGWHVSRTAHTSFVLNALEQALLKRRPRQGGKLIHHADCGSQYISIKYTERLAEAGIEPSVGSVGDFTTTRSPRPSTASTRPNSSTGAPGNPSSVSNSPPSYGAIGSTTGASWSPSAISRPQKLKSNSTKLWKANPWQRNNLNQIASGKPGAVQTGPC